MVGGAAGGALLGAAAANAALRVAIGGPVGLLGGYLLGDKFFWDDPLGKRRWKAGGPSSSPEAFLYLGERDSSAQSPATKRARFFDGEDFR